MDAVRFLPRTSGLDISHYVLACPMVVVVTASIAFETFVAVLHHQYSSGLVIGELLQVELQRPSLLDSVLLEVSLIHAWVVGFLFRVVLLEEVRLLTYHGACRWFFPIGGTEMSSF